MSWLLYLVTNDYAEIKDKLQKNQEYEVYAPVPEPMSKL